eukprot:7221764-Lingulodinium_polyedra.AAC.1
MERAKRAIRELWRHTSEHIPNTPRRDASGNVTERAARQRCRSQPARLNKHTHAMNAFTGYT